MFKPFVFVNDLKPLDQTSSPGYGADDPVKKKPRFQSKPDRKHPLFVRHEVAAAIIESFKVWHLNPPLTTYVYVAVCHLEIVLCVCEQDKGKKMTESMRKMEKEKMTQMEELLSHGVEEADSLRSLFSDCVKEELDIYSKG